ncbi:MAG: prenyltransferase/squalene oxidase repeat-containing protein [Planctomycetota bacterium]|nr:prenyltransferase/squalene oxidase repeat-containing protein [Planctomycetota bacterium]
MSTATPPAEAEQEQNPSEETSGGNRFIFFNAVPSWLVSAILHLLLVVLLAFWPLPGSSKSLVELLTETEEPVEVEELELKDFTPTDLQQFEDAQPQEDEFMVIDDQSFEEEVEIETFDFETSESELDDPLELKEVQPTAMIGITANSKTLDRSTKSKKKMLKEAGGNEASERAVLDALNWIVQHQLPDGGWSFDHTTGPGTFRKTPGPGEARQARFGATAMAILPLLGAGQTHLEGEAKFKASIRRGLMFLVENQKRVALPGGGVGGSFFEPGGNMYSHGLATIAICEAYAMTKDRDLLYPAQAAINFIVYAQDDTTGGWRYAPRAGGDTSVVGWQFMALKSGQMGFLTIPERTVGKAIQFLDSVQAESGAKYGYVEPGGGSSTTSIGLLCRMYLGWDKENPAMARGVEYLGKQGPSKNNMYYNYYATQVMRHYGGDEWKKWNKAMRDYLITQQSKKGNVKGSWYFDHHWSKRGGRLYNTSLACMVLEVYYRHLPIYGSKAAEEEFPLE